MRYRDGVTSVAVTGLCSRRSRGRREHHPVVGPAVAVCEHAADWMIAVHVDTHGVAVPQLVADLEIYALSQNELALAVHVDGFPDLAFHRPRRVGQSRHRDPGRGR